jgi:hypothetical protein
VTVVAGANIDTLAELSVFDVVVLSDVQASGAGPHDYALFDAVIDDFVMAGGGLVASGWHLWNNTLPANLSALCPVSADQSYGGALTVAPVVSTQIGFGIGSFTSPAYTPSNGGAIKSGATPILMSGASPVGAAWAQGLGRSVFVAPLYLESYTSYASQSLLDGTQPNAIAFYINTIEWAGGAL